MSSATLKSLRDYLDDADGLIATMVTDLLTAREAFAREVSATVGDDAQYRAIVDAELSKLEEAERRALQRLQELESYLRANLDNLATVPYRPKHAIDEERARDLVPQYTHMAETLPFDLLLEELDGTLFVDRDVEKVAWSLVRPAIEGRLRQARTTEDQKVANKIRLRVAEMQLMTGEPAAQKLHKDITDKLATVREQKTKLTMQRIAHDPRPGFGSALLTMSFDTNQHALASQKRYDPEALALRLDVPTLGLGPYSLSQQKKMKRAL